MLHQLSADDPRFKTASFTSGMNLIVAEKRTSSTETDSRNSAGKSSLIELIHFLLGARVDKRSLVSDKQLRNVNFHLKLDWPSTGLLTVGRRASRPNAVQLDPDIRPDRQDEMFPVGGPAEVSLDEWNKLIEKGLFGVRADASGVSGRTMLSFLVRRASAHGFNQATESFSKQRKADAATNLAYLLGLDYELADRYRKLAAQKATRTQLRKAVNDPVWGRIVGSTADLRGQIALAEAQLRRLEDQISNFQVVPEYERVKEEADALARRIKQLAQEDIIDQSNLEELQQAVTEASDVAVDYLESAYRELGILLGDQVRRRFDDVQTFHQSVVRNRRAFLEAEIETLTSRLAERRAERARLGEQQAQLLRMLNEGGALEALTALQQALARERANVEALRHRYEAAQALEASARQITTQRLQQQQAVATDLNERREQQAEATLLFSRFARELYGEREAYLRIEAGRENLQITPYIRSDNSRGIGNMVIFCFDLAISILAHRHGRGPDFLVHDSHLFDGVDERQLAKAFALAAEVSAEEGMQYIATINSDDLAKAVRLGFDDSAFVREPRLTDDLEDGGLFGFRF
ncbi:ABC-three component system protein [Streptomyces africanus]|uniref:ABC-three component system protein n=1 Tax=Streptomyces africanus TaxID=231024 RepID=UPI000A3CE61F|nr:ABC-three component system protein [Streptomyces africanus]